VFLNVDRRGRRAAAGCVIVLCAVPLTAQDDTGKKSAGAVRSQSFPGIKEAGSVRAGQAKSEPGVLGAKAAEAKKRTLFETTSEVSLRGFRAETAPEVVKLAKGTLVWAGGTESYGFVPVVVPGGFSGWVHHGFLRVGADGWGTTKGSRVSFRCRKQTSEPPLAHMRRGLRVPVLRRDGDWWEVLSTDEIAAWAAADKLNKIGEITGPVTDAALKRRLEAQRQLRTKAWRARLDELAVEVGKKERVGAIDQAIHAARTAYNAEVRNAAGNLLAEDLGKIMRLIDGIDAMVKKAKAESGPVAVRVADLRKEVVRRRTLREAERLLATTAKKPPAGSAKSAIITDASHESIPARRRFLTTGWLEYRPGVADYSAFRLVKGGHTLYYVTCSKGRYALPDFVGRELGLRGRIARPADADLRVIDVDRLVVLSGR
jgi:hypothetical protein